MPTTGYTPAEVWENLPLIGGRPSVAEDELVRRLQEELPPAVDYANTQMDRTSTNGIIKPDHYLIAPADLADVSINSVVVRVNAQMEFQGSQAFKMSMDATIFFIDKKWQTPMRAKNAKDLACIAAAVLRKYMSGCADLENRWAWRQLIPQMLTHLPENFTDAGYSGCTLSYLLTQSHPDNLWT